MKTWWSEATRRALALDDGRGGIVPAWTLAGPFRAEPLGWVLHVVCGDGSPFHTFATAPIGTRRFSHLWFAKSGRVEQYAPVNHQSWAQAAGNATYVSCETEGEPEEPLTEAQVESLARFHVWLGADDTLADRPGERGIGVHYMGGADWGHHSCPDPTGQEGHGPRSRARYQILGRAASLRAPAPEADMPLSTDDLNNIAAIVWSAKFGQSPTTGTLLQHAGVDVNALATAVAAHIEADQSPASPIDVPALAKAVVDELLARLAGHSA